MQKINKAIHENERLLMYYYTDSLSKIKQQIIDAAKNGHDTTHLKEIKKNVEAEIDKLDKRFQFYSKQTISQTYKKGVKGSEENCKQLKIPFEPMKGKNYMSFGGIHKEAAKALAINTYKPLRRIVDIVGRDCLEYLERTNFKKTEDICKGLNRYFAVSEDLRKTGLTSVQGVVNGNKTWANAMADFQKSFMNRNILEVPYYKKDGSLHCMVNLADYAELVARTTTAEAFRVGAENQILDTFDEGDLVQINGHSKFPNSPCLPFEGAILSLRGKTEGYMTIKEAKAQGLFHPNCIHHFGVTLAVMDEYDRIEAGKGQGTVLKKPEEMPTRFRSGNEANTFFSNDTNYKEWKSKQTEEHQKAFIDYTNNLAYEINGFLRGKETQIPEWKQNWFSKSSEKLDESLSEFNLSKPLIVFRGVDFEAFNTDKKGLRKLTGSKYTDAGYMSTSCTRKGVVNAKGEEMPILMEIDIPSGKGRGAYINEFSTFKDKEFEFLIPKGQEFDILDVSKKGKQYIIKMKLKA